jgi:hypothetical protein
VVVVVVLLFCRFCYCLLQGTGGFYAVSRAAKYQTMKSWPHPNIARSMSTDLERARQYPDSTVSIGGVKNTAQNSPKDTHNTDP